MVDKRLKEARQHGAMGLPVGCYRIRPPYPAHCEELECHWHDEMELFKVERGTVRVRCGSEYFEARAGEMVFFNSGELHAAQPLEGGPRSMSCGCGPSCWRFSLCWQRAAGRALPPGNRPQPRG